MTKSGYHLSISTNSLLRIYHGDLEDSTKIHLLEFQKIDFNKIKELFSTFEKKFVFFENVDLNDLDKTTTTELSKSMHKNSMNSSKAAPYQLPPSSKTTSQYQNPKASVNHQTIQNKKFQGSNNNLNKNASSTNLNNTANQSSSNFSSSINNSKNLANTSTPSLLPLGPQATSNKSNNNVTNKVVSNNAVSRNFQFKSTSNPNLKSKTADITKSVIPLPINRNNTTITESKRE